MNECLEDFVPVNEVLGFFRLSVEICIGAILKIRQLELRNDYRIGKIKISQKCICVWK
jgi:hypothetical protein